MTFKITTYKINLNDYFLVMLNAIVNTLSQTFFINVVKISYQTFTFSAVIWFPSNTYARIVTNIEIRVENIMKDISMPLIYDDTLIARISFL